MTSKGRTYEIVEALTGGPPSAKPVLSRNGHIIPSSQLLIFNKTTDNIRKTDHYRVRFDIDKFAQSPLRFTPNQSDALWVKLGTGAASCPTSACHDLPDTFWIDEMDPNGEWIDVINMDMSQQEFWFTLNLVPKTDPTSTTYVPVDPGGGNQNGGLPGKSYDVSAFGAFVVGLGVGALAYVGAQLLLTS